MKVACERTVLDGAAVGDGDPARADRRPGGPDRPVQLLAASGSPAGGEVLAPGDPADVMQVADVRDLAAWAVTACEQRTTGVYDGSGRRCRCPTCSRSAPRGSASDVDVDLGRPGVPDRGQASSPGWARTRSRCGCPAPSTTAWPRTTCSPPWTPGSPCARSPRPPATPSPGSRPTPRRLVSGIGLDRERELLDGLAPRHGLLMNDRGPAPCGAGPRGRAGWRRGTQPVVAGAFVRACLDGLEALDAAVGRVRVAGAARGGRDLGRPGLEAGRPPGAAAGRCPGPAARPRSRGSDPGRALVRLHVRGG